MSEPMGHTERLRQLWISSDPSRRESLRRIWPDLGDCLDAVAWRPLEEMLIAAVDQEVAKLDIDVDARLREVLEKANVPEEMIRKMTCDGCRTIERMRAKVKPGDEEDFYRFRRAERKHREECPNK